MDIFCFKKLKCIGQKSTIMEREKPFGFSGGPRIVFITSLSTLFFFFIFFQFCHSLRTDESDLGHEYRESKERTFIVACLDDFSGAPR